MASNNAYFSDRTRSWQNYHMIRVSMLVCPKRYHLVMTNTLPWKLPIFITVNHLFLWAIYTMAMLVITTGYVQNHQISLLL